MNFSSVFVSISLMFILCSCANLASLQDGRTLPKSGLEVTPYLSVANLNETFPEKIDKNSDYKFIPTIGARALYGFRENFSVGANLDFSTNIGISGKYQIIGSDAKNFNTSIGFDGGINIYSFFYEKLTYFYSIPAYISYNPNENLAFFVTPRFINNSSYIYKNEYQKVPKGFEYRNDRFALSYGVLFGRKNKYGLEISHFSKENFIVPTTVSVGYKWKLR